MAPLIAGALIGGGASILGGLIGRDSARSQAAQSARLQEEFAKHGVQWRVEDAKAAGVHPVYALGGSGASSAGIPVMADPLGQAVSDMGQNLGRAIGAQETDVQRAQRHIALQLANASIAKDMAQANYYNSLAATSRQASAASAPMPDALTSVDPIVTHAAGSNAASGRAGSVVVQPSKVEDYARSDPSVAAGRDVMWKEFRVGGRNWVLPNANSASEALEAVSESWPLTMVVIRENMRRNPNFLRENQDILPFGREAFELMDALGALASRDRRVRAPEDYRWSDVIRPGLQPYFQRLQRR